MVDDKASAESISARIRELLTRTKMTQLELAQKAGLTPSAVSHYMRGDRIPRAENIKKIAAVFDVSTAYLIGDAPKGMVDFEQLKRIVADNVRFLSKGEKYDLLFLILNSEECYPRETEEERRARERRMRIPWPEK